MNRTVTIAALSMLVGSAAWAAHRDYSAKRVQEAAHRVESSARHVHRAAERYRHHGDHREEEALRRLHYLEDRARHFHRQVERYYRDPAHTERDFRALADAYYRAAAGLGWLHAERRVYREFDRLSAAMDDLFFVYGYDTRGRHGYDRHGYDRHGYRSYGDDDSDSDSDRRHYRHPRRHAVPRFHFQWRWWR